MRTGQGTTSVDTVGGSVMYVPREDTAQWQLAGPTMDPVDVLTNQNNAADVIMQTQLHQTIATSPVLFNINATEYFCNDLIYQSAVSQSYCQYPLSQKL